MISISAHQYFLNPVSDLNARVQKKTREGALIRCVWPDQKIGYADLFPWPELGDLNLAGQLQELAHGSGTALSTQAIWLARRDAELRAEKINALSQTEPLKNHFLVNDLAHFLEKDLLRVQSLGFGSLKIKLGKDLAHEIQILKHFLQISLLSFRLDLNSSATFQSFRDHMEILGPDLRSRIEFVEDPFPYDREHWTEASKLVPLALDHEFQHVDWSARDLRQKDFQYLILKPARQNVDQALLCCRQHELKCVVTSSLDHPLGVIHSALIASHVNKVLPGPSLDSGCLSFGAYETNAFNAEIQTQGPYLKAVTGTGVGFDHLLRSLAWTSIKQA